MLKESVRDLDNKNKMSRFERKFNSEPLADILKR